MGLLVGVAVHQVGAAEQAVAAGAANLLVVAFEGCGHAGMNHGADIGLVDAHAKGDGGDDDLDFSSLEGSLDTFAGVGVEAGVVGGGGNPACPALAARDAARSQFFGQLLRLLARSCVDDGWPTR